MTVVAVVVSTTGSSSSGVTSQVLAETLTRPQALISTHLGLSLMMAGSMHSVTTAGLRQRLPRLQQYQHQPPWICSGTRSAPPHLPQPQPQLQHQRWHP
jgi:hypothetical protein